MEDGISRSVGQSVSKSIGKAVSQSVRLSVCPSVHLSVCPSVSLSVRQSVSQLNSEEDSLVIVNIAATYVIMAYEISRSLEFDCLKHNYAYSVSTSTFISIY